MINETKVTIITVTYNSENNIEKTIQSVINQLYSNIEYIIVDGNSTDNTLNIIKKYKNRINYWISEPDSGIYNAMNKALKLSNGEWVFFLNSGDILESPYTLKKIPFNEYNLDEKIAYIFGKVRVLQYNGVYNANFDGNPFFLNKKKFKNMGFSHQSVFTKTKYIKAIGFNEDYKLCADYLMFVRLNKEGYLGHEIDQYISVIEGRYGASQQNALLQIKETAKICGYNEKDIYYKYRFLRAYIGLLKMNLLRKIWTVVHNPNY